MASNAFAQEWGTITPEAYDQEKGEAMLVFNLLFHGEESDLRNQDFIVGRVSWYSKQLPESSSFLLILDVRGQDVSAAQLQSIQAKIDNRLTRTDGSISCKWAEIK